MTFDDVPVQSSSKSSHVTDWLGFEVYDPHGALDLIKQLHPQHYIDLCATLSSFRFQKDDVLRAGGGKTNIAGRLEADLNARGWMEHKFLQVPVEGGLAFDTHRIDCCKGRIVLEIEWNNKDTFFDRDLNAFRILHAAGLIDCAIIITRSSRLQAMFRAMVDSDGMSKDKFVSTTTHMDRVKPRLASRAAGGCPVLVLGITERCFVQDDTLVLDPFIFAGQVLQPYQVRSGQQLRVPRMSAFAQTAMAADLFVFQ